MKRRKSGKCSFSSQMLIRCFNSVLHCNFLPTVWCPTISFIFALAVKVISLSFDDELKSPLKVSETPLNILHEKHRIVIKDDSKACFVYVRVSSAKNFFLQQHHTSLCWRWRRFRAVMTEACGFIYLHQLSPTSRGCSIWKRRSSTLPVSAGTRSALWSTSACSRSTWLDADERIWGKNE